MFRLLAQITRLPIFCYNEDNLMFAAQVCRATRVSQACHLYIESLLSVFRCLTLLIEACAAVHALAIFLHSLMAVPRWKDGANQHNFVPLDLLQSIK